MQESYARTIAKSVSYRSAAIVSSVIIVGWVDMIYVELSKTLIFIICERLWLRSIWQIHNGVETITRSLVKAVVYRLVATIAVSYWVGIVMALWLAFIQTALFVANDRIWQLVSWGKDNHATG